MCHAVAFHCSEQRPILGLPPLQFGGLNTYNSSGFESNLPSPLPGTRPSGTPDSFKCAAAPSTVEQEQPFVNSRDRHVGDDTATATAGADPGKHDDAPATAIEAAGSPNAAKLFDAMATLSAWEAAEGPQQPDAGNQQQSGAQSDDSAVRVSERALHQNASFAFAPKGSWVSNQAFAAR